MSKINGALHEIRFMDQLAGRKQWLNNIHPLVKLIVTVLYIVTVVSIGKYNLTSLILLGIYPVILFIAGELSFFTAVKKTRLILPFIMVIGIFNPIFDRELLFYIGKLPVTSGMMSMITLIIKGFLTVFASYLLIATTTIEKICYALRLIHIPEIIVTQILLNYRYISVLLQETNRLTQAYALRAPNQKGINIKAWGPLAGQLLIRSIDRAQVVYDSMILRGYTGNFKYVKERKCSKEDYCYLLAWLLVFVVIKGVL